MFITREADERHGEDKQHKHKSNDCVEDTMHVRSPQTVDV
ncbi:hypothetical protein ABID20_004521 [Rhizobium alvei]